MEVQDVKGWCVNNMEDSSVVGGNREREKLEIKINEMCEAVRKKYRNPGEYSGLDETLEVYKRDVNDDVAGEMCGSGEE